MSGALNYQSPGAYLQELNPGQQTNGVSTTIGCMTAAFKRGPVGPAMQTSGPGFTLNYGQIDNSWGYGHITGLTYLSKANRLLVNRVVDPTTCSYASASVFNQAAPLGPGTSTMLASGSNLFLPYSGAATADLNEIDSRQLVIFAPLVTGQSVTVTIGNTVGGTTTNTVIPAISYTTSSDVTLELVAAAIQATLATLGIVSTCLVINDTQTNTGTGVEIMMDYGTASTAIGFTATISGAGSQKIMLQRNSLFQVFARDPGAYGNNIGFNITNANTAPPPTILLQFTYVTAGDAATLTAAINYNGTIYTVVGTGTSIALAVAAFITNYTNTFGGIAAGFSNVNSTTKVYTISLNAPAYGLPFTLTSTTFTAFDTTTSTPMATVAPVINANSSFNNFTLNVYLNGSSVPVETFVVSLQNQLDGFGRQQFIESVVNTGTNGPPSNYIRVNFVGSITNPGGNVSPSFLTGATTSNSSPIVYLGGGEDGLQPTDSDIINSINLLSSSETYQFNLALNAGYSDVVVQQALVNLAQTRTDHFVILDMPSNVQNNSTSAATYASSTLGVNSSYAGIYTPDVYVLDTVNNQYIYAPPSGFVGAQFAATDINFAVWFNAAGLKRGVLNNVVSLRANYDQGDREILATANVNTIKPARNGSGNVIWDVLTLSTPRNLLSFVSVRRTFIFLEQSILGTLEGDVFDNINQQTEFLITQAINGFLQPIKDAEGINNFYVLCNSTNNPSYLTDEGQLVVTVYIVPVTPARIIALRTVVTPNSITFSELISNGVF